MQISPNACTCEACVTEWVCWEIVSTRRMFLNRHSVPSQGSAIFIWQIFSFLEEGFQGALIVNPSSIRTNTKRQMDLHVFDELFSSGKKPCVSSDTSKCICSWIMHDTSNQMFSVNFVISIFTWILCRCYSIE